MKSTITLASSLASLAAPAILLGGFAHAQEPSWVKSLSANGPGSFSPMPACEMTFDAGWKDIAKAGQIKVSILPSGDSIKVMGQGADVGAAAAILPVEGEFVSLIDAATLLPKLSEQTQKRKDSVLLSQVDFSGGKVSSTKSLKVGGTGEEVKHAKQLMVPKAYDLISAALFLRSQPLKEVGESYTIAVVPQSSAKPLTAKVVERGKYSYNGNMIDAIKVEVAPAAFKPTAEEEAKAKADAANESLKDKTKEIFKGTLSSVYAWISDDADRLPLEISVNITPIGAVGAKLVEFKKN
jgi:hypothetical protein